VPLQLNGIMAGLLILENENAVSVVEEIGSLIGELIQHGYDGVGSQQLNLLADAIVSVEYYMETLQSGRKEPVYMLDNAKECLKALREVDIPALPRSMGGDASNLTTTMQMPDYSATIATAQTQVMPGLQMVSSGEGERIDPELIELFIEEAGEEIESIRKHFPTWQNDESQHELLSQIRRSFHTLKGSGRMVGAEVIGEFCWKFEDLLNRLINGTLKNTPSIVDCVQRATEALPEILEQFEAGTEPKIDLEELMRAAEELAQGPAEADQDAYDPDATLELMPGIEPEVIDPGRVDDGVIDPGVIDHGTTDSEMIGAEMIGPEMMGEEQAESVVRLEDESEATDLPPAIDPVLLDILSKETVTHLDVIAAFIEATTDSVAPFNVDEDLHRACHTLHGSVTMANAVAALAVTGPLNQMIRRAYDHDQPIGESAVAACADTVTVIAMIMDCLQRGDDALPDTTELRARLGSIDVELKAQIALAEAKADETIPPETIVTAAPTSAGQLDFDPEIAAIFSEEAAEILESIDAELEQATDNELGGQALAALQRHLHTLKGGARLTGLLSMGDVSHDLETLLVRIDSGQLEQSTERFDVLRAVVDELHRMRDQLALGQIEAAPPELVARLLAALGDDAGVPSSDLALDTEVPVAESADEELEAVEEEEKAEEEIEEEVEQPSSIPASEQLGELARQLEAPAVPEMGDLAELVRKAPETRMPERRELARVDSALLENLLNNAGEVTIFHSRLSQQMGQIQFNLIELGQTVVRLRDQLRNLEIATEAQIIYRHQLDSGSDDVDPLKLERYSKIQQLARSLAETANDVSSLKDLLQNNASDTEALLVQQARTAAELQDGLMRTRMVGFQQQGGRLTRLVRQLSGEHDKQVELMLHGGGEIDRQVLEKMLPPIEHMVRNAVIHGIESPEEREAAGKPEVGCITITLRREGAQVVIEIADDGRGMNPDEILRKAIELGLTEPDVDLSSDEILQFVLSPGFSTADRLTHAAGRGVGMDVVVSEITKLGGTLHIDSQLGEGTTFSVRLPFTLAITQALIVRVAHELFALPLPTIEGIIRISRAEFDAKLAAEAPVVEYAGREYQFRHLGQYLGLGPARLSEEEERVSVILVHSGKHLTALVADEMLDSREIVVKPVGGQLATIQGISGATILGDGRIVVILDINSLVRALPAAIEPGEIQPEPLPDTSLALVVDDSITMRRVTQRLLERHGMRVVTAKDGIEAIGVLREHTPDIILLDVEMPRMDGYEFASHVRNDPETAGVPIIMITSRVSDKHKARAIELGVNDYLGKPYQETNLMAAVNDLLNRD
jgi:chemosensory pili system protein ChpA (sensor histidine kinase/response regulator)